MLPCPEDASKFSTTAKYFGGFNNSLRPVGPNVKVTDIVVRGGGGTITFSDGVTVEYVFGFRPDASIPSGGIFDVTLQGPRADLVYENIVSQAVCDMIDWLMQCSSLNVRISILEAKLGLAEEFSFEAADWDAGTPNAIEIVQAGALGPGQIGPHGFLVGKSYHISVFKADGSPLIVGVDVEFEISLTTGQIRLKKSGKVIPYGGRVIVSSIAG